MKKLLLLGVLTWAAIALANTGSTGTSAPRVDKLTNAYNKCEPAIKRALKDPGSYTIEKNFGIPAPGQIMGSEIPGTNVTAVLVNFRANNSFGALVKNSAGCLIENGVAEVPTIEAGWVAL